MTRGGVRAGAGRKKTGRTEALNCMVRPEYKQMLEQHAKESNRTVTEVLEEVLQYFYTK